MAKKSNRCECCGIKIPPGSTLCYDPCECIYRTGSYYLGKCDTCGRVHKEWATSSRKALIVTPKSTKVR
jgi:hypothetical protein